MQIGIYRESYWVLSLIFVAGYIFVCRFIKKQRIAQKRCIECGYVKQEIICSECGSEPMARRRFVWACCLWLGAGILASHALASYGRLRHEGISGLVPTSFYFLICRSSPSAISISVKAIERRYTSNSLGMFPAVDLSDLQAWQRIEIIKLLARATIEQSIRNDERQIAFYIGTAMGIETWNEKVTWVEEASAGDDEWLVKSLSVVGIYPDGSVPDTASEFVLRWEKEGASPLMSRHIRKALNLQ